ncbi:MAG: GDP-mannose 4,6-dehydratase [Lachnospiraceae bacterium]|nr:GDP-mannose 4,6-dehydratase [Lachnospiraceae bacterium]
MEKKRFLITGFSGFVGRHFLHYLYDKNEEMEIFGIDIRKPAFDVSVYADRLHIQFEEVNLLNRDELKSVIERFRPQYILHLASFSSVAFSWQHPEESFVNNTNIFLNLTGVLKELELPCRVLSIGSSEEYGNVMAEHLPLRESMQLQPVSPYAVARVSQEMLSKVFVDSYHLDIILTRSFNHIGPWQDERFVVPSFIRRILNIKDEGLSEGTIETGDTTIVRDFVDVRDVVNAYYMLLMDGTPGEIYNICSGTGIALADIIDQVADIVGIKVHTKVNPEYVRPNDNRVVIGSHDKLTTELGWQPVISWNRTLRDMVEEMSK